MRRLGTFLLLLLALSIATAVSAQRLCEALVEQALQSAAQNCNELDGSLGCYGHDRLTATYQEASEAADAFSNPGGTIDLPLLHTAHTAGLDLEEDEWGIAYFRVLADVAGDDTEETVRIIMLGDVFLESVVDETNTEPMRKLFFATGDPSDCQEAPNMVVIQGPDDKPVDLVVNEVPIRIGSTIALGLTGEDEQDAMWITVLSGNVTLYPDTPDAVSMVEGQTTSAQLSPSAASDDGTGIVVIDKVTGQPIIGPDGKPFTRRAPVVAFDEPKFLSDVTGDTQGDTPPSFDNPVFYQTITQLPETMLNYTLPEIPSEQTILAGGGGGNSCNLETDPAARGITGHKGPGYNRVVLREVPSGENFTPTNVENVNGELWFELATESGTVVWVEAASFTNVADCGDFVEEVLGEPIPTPLPPEVADHDLDGIADASDLCPQVAGPASTKGCPKQS